MRYQKIAIAGSVTFVMSFQFKPRMTQHLKNYHEQVRLGFIKKKKQTQRRISNLKTTKNNFIKLILTNLSDPRPKHMLTLTFNIPITSIEEASKYFNNFTKRLNYEFGLHKKKFDYIAVPEFQPVSGRVHYHLFTLGLQDYAGNEKMYSSKHDLRGNPLPCSTAWFSYKSYIGNIWGHGYVHLQRVHDTKHPLRFARYMAKYFTKNYADERLLRKRLYRTSKTIQKATEIIAQNGVSRYKISKSNITREQHLNLLSTTSNKPSYTNFFATKYLGQAVYEVYDTVIHTPAMTNKQHPVLYTYIN